MLCKAPRPLDRSDSHNNNNRAPSLQQMLGIIVQESFTNPQPVMDNTHPKSSHLTTDETSKENHLTSELAHEDPFLPPRRRQRAATVVPEQNMAKNSRSRDEVPDPVTCPHPPPSLRILAPSPQEEGGINPDLSIESSHHVPEPKTDCVELSPDTADQNDSHLTESTMPQKLELCLDAVSNDEGNLLTSSTPEADSPSEAPSVLEVSSNDDNNNPNVADSSENAAASNLSTDSIDFFSAREKFLYLSHDGQPRSLSEPTDVRPLHSRCTPPLEDLSVEADEVRFGKRFKYMSVLFQLFMKDKFAL